MKNKLLNLIIALIISLPVLSQTNPRTVNENYVLRAKVNDEVITEKLFVKH